jgi:hypothetical protein
MIVTKPTQLEFEPTYFGRFNRYSQVKLLTTNNACCIVQRATAQSKTGIFRGYGKAEAPQGF